jgi:pimeloyl-ACP methyl ester carboxylesterase
MRGMRGGAGPTALLLHGTAGSWRNFNAWLPALLPRAHLVIPDLPGFGESPVPAVRPRLRTWARLLHALMAELGEPPRILIGLGFGASVAMAYLEVQSPTGAAGPTIERLVLHTPAYYPGAIRPAFRYGVRALGSSPVFPLVRRVLEHPRFRAWYLAHMVEGPDVAPADAQLLREDFERASLPVLRGLARDIVRADYRPLLRGLATPTLVIVAAEDQFVFPRELEKLAWLMPHARVVVQANIGHGWTADAVAEHHRLLVDFLGALASSDADPR